MSLPESAEEFLSRVEARLRGGASRKRIVFPEGTDPRVVAAAERLRREGLAEPILIGRDVDPATSPQAARYARLYLERRGRRGVTERQANEIAQRPLYFAALMVAAGDADGSVGGAANSTAETVRAALHAVGSSPGVRTVSSFFVLGVRDRSIGARGLFIAADCAVVVSPDTQALADIAWMVACSARTFLETEPVVGLLPGVPAEAALILRERAPELKLRFGDEVWEDANALVFPDLASSNIGYKMVEWLGHGAAFGPMLQGLAKPANDLSRACTPDDVYTVALITALQAGA